MTAIMPSFLDLLYSYKASCTELATWDGSWKERLFVSICDDVRLIVDF